MLLVSLLSLVREPDSDQEFWFNLPETMPKNEDDDDLSIELNLRVHYKI